MLKKTAGTLLLICVALLGSASTAAAQQTLNFTLGYFTPKGVDARVGSAGTGDQDVLVANSTFLVFDLEDFNGPSIGAEWLVPIGNYVEAGAGLSFTRRTVPSVYRDYVDDFGDEIDQDLRLRRIPFDFTVRVLPLGQRSAFQPYFGAGLSVINWRYSESGEFIDFSNGGREIFQDTYVADGNATGPVVLGGIRFASDTVSAGGEIRFHSADGEVGSDFAGTRIDLGGWTYQFTMGVRFGR